MAVGGGEYNVFVKDMGSGADYIRLSFGYSELKKNTKTARIMHKWITEPKRDSGTFLGRFNKYNMHGRRLWIVFETVQRVKGKRGKALEHYAGYSPPFSKWRKSIGAETLFELKKVNIEEYAQITGLELPDATDIMRNIE